MDHPKISIVTPSLNQGEFLERTIRSVLDQNYPNLEYIIIDGGSTDNSIEIIKKYEKHLKYWVSEPDSGMYDALRKGFEKSTGELIAWNNSDEMYQAGSFFTVAEIFSTLNEVNWLQGQPTHFDNKGRTVAVLLLRKWSKYNFYSGDFKWIQQESTFWRRSLWEKAGSRINTELKYAGDLELWLRFFRHEKLFVTSALIGGFRIRNADQLSLTNFDAYINEAEKCIALEKLNDLDSKRLKEINYYRKLVSAFSRFNIGRLTVKYFDKFEYPPRVVFNRELQKFELKNPSPFF